MQKNEKSICLYGREANNTEKNIPQKSLLEMFLENVNKNADSPAIIYDGVNNFTGAAFGGGGRGAESSHRHPAGL